MGEWTSHKALWIFYFFLIIVALSYGYIGASSGQKEGIVFYVALLGLPGMVIVFFDWASGDKLEEIDTITIEEPHDSLGWLSPKYQIVVGILLAGLIFWKIAVTGSAFVDAPKWSMFDSPVGNAIFSGLIGTIENLTFFGIIFPTVASIIGKHSGSEVLGLVVAVMIATAVFVGYHNWRYGFSETALLSVAIFALINVFVIYTTQSIIISDLIHFGNNFAVGLGLATKIALAVIL